MNDEPRLPLITLLLILSGMAVFWIAVFVYT